MKISGHVDRVFRRDPESGYVHFSLAGAVCEDGGDSSLNLDGLGFKGCLLDPDPGMRVSLTGDIVKTGERFHFKFDEAGSEYPSEFFQVKKFLETGGVPGVKGLFGTKIASAFGPHALRCILENSTFSAHVPGIPAEVRGEIVVNWEAKRAQKLQLAYLVDRGVRVDKAIELYATHGSGLSDHVRKNPYALIKDGLSFTVADKLAKALLNIEAQDPRRLSAALSSTWQERTTSTGSTGVSKADLNAAMKRLLKTGHHQDYMGEIDRLILNDKDFSTHIGPRSGVIVVRDDYQRCHSEIKEHLARLMATARPAADEGGINVKDPLVAACLGQREAVLMAVKHPVSIITGGPGTGKTTTVKAALDTITDHFRVEHGRPPKFRLLAPTGMASQRVQESTEMPATTIHRALGATIDGGFGRDEFFSEDVFGVDEMSMNEPLIFSELLRRIPDGGKLIMLGDTGQLRSVPRGRLLDDLIDCQEIPVAKLTEVHRNAGPIAENCDLIRQGKMPSLAELKSLEDVWAFRPADGDFNIQKAALALFTAHRENGVIPKIICPTNKTKHIGTLDFNRAIQQQVNPVGSAKGDVYFEATQNANFHQGDHVLIRKSIRVDDEELVNGQRGEVKSVDNASQTVSVEFECDDGKKEFSMTDGNRKALCHSWALTVHKLQGSEISHAILPMSLSYTNSTRASFYTAASRGKAQIVMVGDPVAIQKAITNKAESVRVSPLADMLSDGIKQELNRRVETDSPGTSEATPRQRELTFTGSVSSFSP